MRSYLQTVGGEANKTLDRIYLTDPNTAWMAILDALKHTSLEVSNREGGLLQTQWIDNTVEKNFSELIGPHPYLKAQYRFLVSSSPGFYNGRASVKISVQKEQWIQKDVLEGWKPLPTDTIAEKTLLYRIGRLIWVKTKLEKAEQESIKESLR